LESLRLVLSLMGISNSESKVIIIFFVSFVVHIFIRYS
jgi:hypothetical protein